MSHISTRRCAQKTAGSEKEHVAAHRRREGEEWEHVRTDRNQTIKKEAKREGGGGYIGESGRAGGGGREGDVEREGNREGERGKESNKERTGARVERTGERVEMVGEGRRESSTMQREFKRGGEGRGEELKRYIPRGSQNIERSLVQQKKTCKNASNSREIPKQGETTVVLPLLLQLQIFSAFSLFSVGEPERTPSRNKDPCRQRLHPTFVSERMRSGSMLVSSRLASFSLYLCGSQP